MATITATLRHSSKPYSDSMKLCSVRFCAATASGLLLLMASHAMANAQGATDGRAVPSDGAQPEETEEEPESDAWLLPDSDNKPAAEDSKGATNRNPWYEGSNEPKKRYPGFVISLAGHAGAIVGVDDSDEAVGVSFLFGLAFSKQFTVGIDWMGLSHGPLLESPRYQLGLFGLAGRFWASERLWLQVGVSGAALEVRDPTGETSGSRNTGFAVSGAAGYQPIQGKALGMDIVLRATTFVLDEEEAGALTFGVGFTNI